jgi:hypothetical protein
MKRPKKKEIIGWTTAEWDKSCNEENLKRNLMKLFSAFSTDQSTPDRVWLFPRVRVRITIEEVRDDA